MQIQGTWSKWQQGAAKQSLMSQKKLPLMVSVRLIRKMEWADTGRMPDTDQSNSTIPEQGRENVIKGSWTEIRFGRDHSANTITGKTDLNWGYKSNLLPKNQHNDKLKKS